MTLWTFGDGPGTHALVVGVGEYPWLVDGTLALSSDHEGMKQLTSSPVSALAFARWLANDYVNTTHPLRTLEVLVSAPNQGAWAPRAGMNAEVPTRARFADFKAALLRWRTRLGPDDRALFFFSGHGMGAGLQHTLVLEDYGSVPHASPMGFALDFTRFHAAMASAPSVQQCYFLDACRTASGAMMNGLGYYGDPVLSPNGSVSPARPVVYATLVGDAAYGRPNETSLYTEALLQTMRGASAERTRRGWAIKISRLYEGLTYHLSRLAAEHDATQLCHVDLSGDFDLHELQGTPEVPVIVECGHPIDVTASTVTVSGVLANRDQPPPVPNPWHIELPQGDYAFAATPGGPTRSYPVYPSVTTVVLP
jgi:hypothetical protein